VTPPREHFCIQNYLARSSSSSRFRNFARIGGDRAKNLNQQEGGLKSKKPKPKLKTQKRKIKI